jgi:hypothetical protein
MIGTLLATLLAVTPTIVQHVSSSTNEQGSGTIDQGGATARNNYEWELPNPVGAGNCLVLATTFQRDVNTLTTGDSVSTITDSSGDTWSTTAIATVGTGAASLPNVRIFAKGSATAGQHVLKVTMSASQATFRYDVFEIYGTDCTAAGTASHTGQTGATIDAGTFTPTNNNGTGGNLILAVFTAGLNNIAPPTLWAAGGGFTLLVADTGSNAAQYAHGAQYLVQTTSASVTPAVTLTSGGLANYTGLAVALKVAAVGTDPATSITNIHVNNIQHTTNGLPPATWTLQTPSTGNMIVGITPSAASCCLIINSVTDNKSNTWTVTNNGDTDAPYIFYCTPPCTTGQDLKVTINAGATHINSTVLMYDLSNVALSSPVDGSPSNVAGTVSCAGSGGGAPADTTSGNTCPEDVFHGMASFTPASIGLTLFSCAYGTGPSRGFHSSTGTQLTRPTGAIWNYVWYTGITDASRMDNSDCQAHFYNNDLTTQNWDVNLDWEYYSPANTATTAFSHLIHIKGQAIPPPPPPIQPPTGIWRRYRPR